MTSLARFALLLIPLGWLAACAAESKAPPVSNTGFVLPPSQEPEPANSLPRGAAVNAPVLPFGSGIVTTHPAQ